MSWRCSDGTRDGAEPVRRRFVPIPVAGEVVQATCRAPGCHHPYRYLFVPAVPSRAPIRRLPASSSVSPIARTKEL